jgi:hypothetical protein
MTDDTQSEAIERALCEANGCVWDLDPDSDSRQQWRRDVATVLAALRQPQTDALKIARDALEVVAYAPMTFDDNPVFLINQWREIAREALAALKETT